MLMLMRKFLLYKVRLSTYFWFFLLFYLVITYVIPVYKFDSGTLTLFSVNSFLYGFYISPILAMQKARIDSLHQVIRSEANSLFDLALSLKHLAPEMRHNILNKLNQYVIAKMKDKNINKGEKEYESLITYVINYKGKEKDEVEKVLSKIVANQKNRTDFSMQYGNKVFSNEWHIVAVLFSITLGFIIAINSSDIFILHLVRALLCTGLTMLIVNLIKLNTLSHKKALQMWAPLKKLIDTNYYRMD